MAGHKKISVGGKTVVEKPVDMYKTQEHDQKK
jgi:hypothetical protein